MSLFTNKVYNTTEGSVTLIYKMLCDKSIAVWSTMRKADDNMIDSMVSDIKQKLEGTSLKLVYFPTIRGKIYRLATATAVIPIREDLFPDPAFITTKEYQDA